MVFFSKSVLSKVNFVKNFINILSFMETLFLSSTYCAGYQESTVYLMYCVYEMQ